MAKMNLCEKRWYDIGYHYFDVYEGYLRISDNEFDIPGAKIILIDAFGSFKAYTLYENKDGELVEVALEFDERMSKTLYFTWKWIKIDWVS